MDAVGDAHLAFITAGLGGGTGTGAAPVIARACRQAGILTVGVSTLPFEFEGQQRHRVAVDGLKTLADAVDALVVLPNQRLLSANSSDIGDMPFMDAFRRIDSVVIDGIESLSELISKPSLINLDFADVRTGRFCVVLYRFALTFDAEQKCFLLVVLRFSAAVKQLASIGRATLHCKR